MKKGFLAFSLTTFGLVFILTLLPLGAANAWIQATPTESAGGLGGFTIPTATPAAGGAGQATPTEGGGGLFTIPTATPADGAAPAAEPLPMLTDEQLQALNLQPGDVPAAFAANQEITPFTAEETYQQLNEFSPELAERFQKITETYGWDKSFGVTYTACDPTVPVSEIYSEINQLSSADAARAFIDDPELSQFYLDIGYQLSPSTTIHGWIATLAADAGACFPQEIDYSLNFEYWGLLISVSLTANADTDPALVSSLLDQLAVIVVGKVDALAATPFPATPVPVGQPAGPEPTLPAAQPTEAAAQPTQASQLPIMPTQAQQQAPAGGGATLQDIESIMPTAQELELPANYMLNESLSRAYTAQEYVAFVQSMGLTDLATAMATAGQTYGLLGQVVRVWDVGDTCPDTGALSLEADIALFQTAEGAAGYINDPAYLQNYQALGVTFEPISGGLLTQVTYQHSCGTATTYNKIMVHGRFTVATNVIVYAGADEQQVMSLLDTFNSYLIQKIDQAGLQ